MGSQWDALVDLATVDRCRVDGYAHVPQYMSSLCLRISKFRQGVAPFADYRQSDTVRDHTTSSVMARVLCVLRDALDVQTQSRRQWLLLTPVIDIRG